MTDRDTQNVQENHNYGGNNILRFALMPLLIYLLLYYYPSHRLVVLIGGITGGLILGQFVPPRLKFRQLVYRILGGIALCLLYTLFRAR
jgi:hypothetical protein